MKKVATLILSVFLSTIYAQEHINLKKGVAVEAYDVVAYFNNEAIKGLKEFETEFDGVSYQFANAENLKLFKKNSKFYIPQYGGYCAYAMAIKNKKIKVNPKSFQIIDDKLYLFYNSWGANALELWNNEDPKKLIVQADMHWEEIIKSKE